MLKIYGIRSEDFWKGTEWSVQQGSAGVVSNSVNSRRYANQQTSYQGNKTNILVK